MRGKAISAKPGAHWLYTPLHHGGVTVKATFGYLMTPHKGCPCADGCNTRIKQFFLIIFIFIKLPNKPRETNYINRRTRMPLDKNLRFFFILKVIKSLHNA
jgi:hypothetical protein